MLDAASIERLAESPQRNDPLLNVALAEEGGGNVLLALADCPTLGAEAIDVIAARVEREADALLLGAEADSGSAVLELDKKLIGHPNASGDVRDAVLDRHSDDAYFVLTAAAHRDATARALEAAASWPAASPLHDRPWLDLLGSISRHAELLRQWTRGDELLRETAGRLAAEPELLDGLAKDPSRRVRRAVASNPQAGGSRQRLAESDPALEVRARAERPALAGPRDGDGRFAASLRAMLEGGVLAHDTRRALLDRAGTLDEEGAFLAARHLPTDDLRALVAHAAGASDAHAPHASGIGLGLGLRASAEEDGHDAALSSEIVHLVSHRANGETRLTGKARVAYWISECMERARSIDAHDLAMLLRPGTLASDRMVLRRWASRGRSLASVTSLGLDSVPAAVIELCWRDGTVSDEDAITLAAKVPRSARSDRELPEDDLDLSPLARPLAVLERAVLAAVACSPVSPRAALAAIALEPRRCRYVLSAMPTWKGALTGARLARVLKSHAGALSAAARPTSSTPPTPTGPRPATVARWTERNLAEAEAAIAIAIGDLTASELLRRLRAGSAKLGEGVILAAGIEARVAIDGPAQFTPLLDYATSRRTADASALALWMLLEELDRTRAPSLIASAIDGLSIGGAVVAPAVCEALATLERRTPGRLENVHAQSPRGRATIASAIARAYRAFGGMRDEA